MGFLDFAESAGGGALLGGALGAVGSLINGKRSSDNAQAQMQMQREFAQNGIRWKVADAKAAGIHPLAALGAQTFSYNPVAVGDDGLGSALQQMGQGITRAAEAKQLAEEREAAQARQEMEDVFNSVLRQKQLERLDLENDVIRQQLASSRLSLLASSQLPPPMPHANNTSPSGQYVKPGGNKFMWLMTPEGKHELFPTEEYTGAFEDKPWGFDLLPILEAGVRQLYGKFTNTPIDGRYWNSSTLDWEPLPKELPKRTPRRSEPKVSSYYSDSYRY